MARDLERYFDELEHRVAQLESELEYAVDKIAKDVARLQAAQQASKRPPLRDVMPDYSKYLEKAQQTTYYGVPIHELDRDELLACVSLAAEELSRSWRFTGLNHGD